MSLSLSLLFNLNALSLFTCNRAETDQVQCLLLERESYRRLLQLSESQFKDSLQKQPGSPAAVQLQQQEQPPRSSSLAAKFNWLKLEQLERLVTLGVGGFGRVSPKHIISRKILITEPFLS